MRRVRWISIGFFMILLPSLVRAGEIRGKVYLSGRPTSQVLVSIEGLPGVAGPAPQTLNLDHTRGDFVPHLLAVLRGTRVVFLTKPEMPCRLYSISRAGIFNLSRQTSKIKSLRFAQAGVILVRCQDHPSAYAYIVVKENPYFTVTGKTGEYSIKAVPSGKRTIRVFFEGRVLLEEAVKIGNRAVVLNLSADRPEKVVFHGDKFSQQLKEIMKGKGETLRW